VLYGLQAEAQESVTQDREIHVIADFLNENGLSQDRGPYVFDQEMIASSSFPDKSVPKEAEGKVPGSLIADFIRANATPFRLPAPLVKKFSIYTFTKKDNDLYFTCRST
jgi:hypothetical protein